jgi:hypothetical protein
MARKKNVIKCSCRQCCFGSRSSWGQFQIRASKRKVRHDTDVLLKKEKFDDALDIIVSAGYLD